MSEDARRFLSFEGTLEVSFLCWEPCLGDRQGQERSLGGSHTPHCCCPHRLPIVLSGASMTRKCQENVKSSVKNGKSLPSGPQRCHGKSMKWEGLNGISFRMCIQEWSAKLR